MKNILSAIVLSGIASGVSLAETEAERYVQQVMDDANAFACSQTACCNATKINLSGFIQTGWQYSNGGGLPSEYGFFVERARLNIGGNFDSDGAVSYLVSGQWDSTSNDFDLLNAFVTLRMWEVANIEIGQFVPDFYAGFVDDPTTLTTYNYSVSALTFGQGRGQGVQLSRNFDNGFQVSGFYNNGFNDFTGVGTDNYAVGFSARYAVSDAISVNGGFAASDEFNTYTLGGDWSHDQFNLNLDWISNDEGSGWDNWSLVTTVAYDFTDSLEGFAQWEYGEYGGDLNLLTVGANYDLSHGLVWTNTFGYALGSLGSNFVTDNTGWRAGSDSGQYVLRSVITFSF